MEQDFPRRDLCFYFLFKFVLLVCHQCVDEFQKYLAGAVIVAVQAPAAEPGFLADIFHSYIFETLFRKKPECGFTDKNVLFFSTFLFPLDYYLICDTCVAFIMRHACRFVNKETEYNYRVAFHVYL